MKLEGNGFKRYLKKHKKKGLKPNRLGMRRLRNIQTEILLSKKHAIKTRAVCFMIIERMIEYQEYTKTKKEKELKQNEKDDEPIYIGRVDF
jgi:hypothetical protein